ncbi:hypothetical protein RFI_21496 [Reticulomyxa filosa]|uniref:Kinetochore protein SPC25 n=1 Tax=Reticulomyxa filosa TaxID=46433 RepID=X6MR32_RETFI|nr:hypothetical protein RFI_21496 [Reticulomyxa filosa]|eukprot:ETO15867.1 hypothetical protein RFI_21496 [Reticulomyxa filosa]
MEEKKVEELEKEVNIIEDRYSTMPGELDRLRVLEEKKRDEMRQYQDKLQSVFAQAQEQQAQLLINCNKYQKNLGVTFGVTQEGHFLVTFRHLDKQNPARECSIVLAVDKQTNTYKVAKSEPELLNNNYEELEKDLNTKSAQFGKLVLTLRLAFQKRLAEQN